MTKAEALELVEKTAMQLGEHFDSVRVFATMPSEDGESNTATIDSGCGNFYAQLGQIHEWLLIQDQYQRNYAMQKNQED